MFKKALIVLVTLVTLVIGATQYGVTVTDTDVAVGGTSAVTCYGAALRVKGIEENISFYYTIEDTTSDDSVTGTWTFKTGFGSTPENATLWPANDKIVDNDTSLIDVTVADSAENEGTSLRIHGSEWIVPVYTGTAANNNTLANVIASIKWVVTWKKQ